MVCGLLSVGNVWTVDGERWVVCGRWKANVDGRRWTDELTNDGRTNGQGCKGCKVSEVVLHKQFNPRWYQSFRRHRRHKGRKTPFAFANYAAFGGKDQGILSMRPCDW